MDPHISHTATTSSSGADVYRASRLGSVLLARASPWNSSRSHAGDHSRCCISTLPSRQQQMAAHSTLLTGRYGWNITSQPRPPLPSPHQPAALLVACFSAFAVLYSVQSFFLTLQSFSTSGAVHVLPLEGTRDKKYGQIRAICWCFRTRRFLCSGADFQHFHR